MRCLSFLLDDASDALQIQKQQQQQLSTKNKSTPSGHLQVHRDLFAPSSSGGGLYPAERADFGILLCLEFGYFFGCLVDSGE